MLQIRGLSYDRDQLNILNQVQFSIDEGEVVLVQGENGSGKTTLIKLLSGLLPIQDQFDITVSGRPFDPSQPSDRQYFHYLGHQHGLKMELTCLENMTFYSQFSGLVDGMSCLDAIGQVGLQGYQYTVASHLSAGQKKRLALARLLLTERPMWLLDEPYSNLDQRGIALVDRLLQGQIDRGGAVLMTSHGTFIPDVSRHREIRLERGVICQNPV